MFSAEQEHWGSIFMWYLLLACFTNFYSCTSLECFQVEQKSCKEILDNGKYCGIRETDSWTILVFCCNITNEKQIEDFIHNKVPVRDLSLSGIHLRDSNLTTLNANIFRSMKALTTLSITNSYINSIIGSFDESNTGLTCLNISMNAIMHINDYLILELAGLKNLVIRNNMQVSTMPFLPYSRSFIELDLSNNYKLSCKYLVNLTESVFKKRILINQINKNSTVCLPPNIYFNRPYIVGMEEIDRVREIFLYCPKMEDKNCSCSVDSLDSDKNGTWVYQALVNCSGLELSSLPRILPPYTRVLDISNNKITSLEGIANSSYDNIVDLFADNNNIVSLGPLEGTNFLDYFQNITLTKNKIEQIHEHIFINAFDRRLGKFLSLADNILKCDCRTATTTKAWLLTFKNYVTDYNEVYTNCGGILLKVIDMDQKDNCPVSHNFGSYFKYLIMAEVSVFILLVGKVSYDYYIFKTHGYLPWPASRMPKLPCDWCFET